MILKIYDRMATAIETGVPYKTILYPHLASPEVVYPPREKVEDAEVCDGQSGR